VPNSFREKSPGPPRISLRLGLQSCISGQPLGFCATHALSATSVWVAPGFAGSVTYQNANPIPSGLPFLKSSYNHICALLWYPSVPVFHSRSFHNPFPESKVSILFYFPLSSDRTITIILAMAPSSGGNATDQSVRAKLVVGVDYGTTYSGMQKSATLFL
jgi:hypothetical protein